MRKVKQNKQEIFFTWPTALSTE